MSLKNYYDGSGSTTLNLTLPKLQQLRIAQGDMYWMLDGALSQAEAMSATQFMAQILSMYSRGWVTAAWELYNLGAGLLKKRIIGYTDNVGDQVLATRDYAKDLISDFSPSFESYNVQFNLLFFKKEDTAGRLPIIVGPGKIVSAVTKTGLVVTF